jgi:hypothetical protein
MSRTTCRKPPIDTPERLCARARNDQRRSAAAAVLGALVVTLCAAMPASAALYKWTDANGVVVYSDQPPPGNVKVETLAGPPPPANPNAAKELANKELDQKKQQTATADTAKKAAQQRADAERLADSCRDARTELTSLSADQVLLYSINEKGEQVMMNDADRKRRRLAVENYLKASCPQG